jgi:rhamnosyltransferase
MRRDNPTAMPTSSSQPGRSHARAAAVCAVLVTHRPDLDILAAALDAVRAQVGALVIVDNASGDPRLRELCSAHPDLVLDSLPENRGLAAALNVGIVHARSMPRCTHVLLLDQDSVPDDGMVGALCSTLDHRAGREKVAAVGPRFHDPRERRDAPFVRIRFPFNRKLHCAEGSPAIRCDFLITSGCLIPLTVLDDIGAMDEALFIDNVDMDWSLRARAAGYALYGVCAARMRHSLGASRRRIPGVPRGIVVHPPGRLYYMMRNRTLLYRRAYTPRAWIAQDVPRLLVKLALFSIVVGPRRENLRHMLAGLRAGLAGRTDPPPAVRRPGAAAA